MTELRQRQPRVEDRKFLAFVRTKPCCSCGRAPRSHAAHIRMACREMGKRETGKGERPSDRWAVPLCQDEHQDGPGAQHKGAEAAFWRRVGIDPFAIAAALYAEFLACHPAKSSILPKGPTQLKPATDSGVKVRRPNRKREHRPRSEVAAIAGEPRRFTFPTDKSKPKMESRPLRGRSQWPKGRKLTSRRR